VVKHFHPETDVMTTLVISQRRSEDNQALWQAAVRRGWFVERLQGIRVRQVSGEVVIYVEALFAAQVAKTLGVKLLTPGENWLVELPHEYRKRQIRITTLGEARRLEQRAFVKPPNEKTFESRVYETGTDLPSEFDDDMAVLIAGPVRWRDEYRCFALDSRVRTLSPYLRSGQLSKSSDYSATDTELREARQFTETVLRDPKVNVPRAIALDVGTIDGRGWAEANGAWGSGIYGCDPDAVLDVIRCATVSAA
jgi:hypothetical protein